MRTCARGSDLIIALVLLGNAMEARAKRNTTRALRQLAKLQPSTARVRRGGQDIDLPDRQGPRGDRIIVRPGERMPVDGVIKRRPWMSRCSRANRSR